MPRLLIASAILALAVGLRFAPRPAERAEVCCVAPSPAVCDLVLVPMVGAAAEEGLPAMEPPAVDLDGYRVHVQPREPPLPRRSWWRTLMELLISSAHASPAPADPLEEGCRALARDWHTVAFRLCKRAAENKRQPGRRAAALVCAGRAALGLKWPAAAISMATQALRLLDERGARLLLADGYRAAGDCKQARPHYLRVLELEPSHAEARAGFAACGGDPPPVSSPDEGAHRMTSPWPGASAASE